MRFGPTLMTFETAAVSPKLAQEVLEQCIREERIRATVFKNGNLKIQWSKQGKHVQGHKNYILAKNKSILEHPDPQRLVNEYAGTGKKIGSVKPGKPGFREEIDFQEFIGYYVNPSTKDKIPTTVGRVHYAKDGVHIVPEKPRGH